MATSVSRSEIREGSQGQLIIPSVARQAMAKRLQDRFRHIPKEVSLANELIEDRRKEVARAVEKWIIR